MIGLLWNWRSGGIDPRDVRAFTTSLAAGTGRAVGHEVLDGLLVVQLCDGEAAARRWRATRLTGGRRILLFHGVVDNRCDLERELGRQPGVAALYASGLERWGSAVDDHVVGSYAAIVADPGDHRVIAVRSPINAPPLHIRRDDTRLAVASLARVTFAIGDERPEIDEQKIADSLILNYAEAERGWYKGVARVATGCRTTITPGTCTQQRYHDLQRVAAVRLRRDADYVEAADALLAAGTRAALQGSTHPAVSLSGGYDSQAVAAYALRAPHAPGELVGLTAVPERGWTADGGPPPLADERHHAAALAAMYPALRSEVIDAAGLSFDHHLTAMFAFCGAPPRNAMNLHWIHAIRSRARQLGCDVVLLGGLGNWSFSFDGAGAYAGWLMQGRWLRLAREVGAARNGRSWPRTLTAEALLPFAPLRIARHNDGDRTPWHALNPNYAREMRVAERAADRQADMTRRARRSTRAYRAAVIGNGRHELGDVQQAMELIHRIPARDPTAYRPLVEFCLGIPDDQFLRGGLRRWLARRMLASRIPDTVLAETRRGQQGADWALRLGRERSALLAELERLADDPAMRHRFDLPRLLTTVRSWQLGEMLDAATAATLQLALPRALATARFIRWVEGGNG